MVGPNVLFFIVRIFLPHPPWLATAVRGSSLLRRGGGEK